MNASGTCSVMCVHDHNAVFLMYCLDQNDISLFTPHMQTSMNVKILLEVYVSTTV